MIDPFWLATLLTGSLSDPLTKPVIPSLTQNEWRRSGHWDEGAGYEVEEFTGPSMGGAAPIEPARVGHDAPEYSPESANATPE
jgi:hypothetical protein